nr:RHS domain-containing protein [Escherichia fergusonii]HDW3143827.1 RHS domain-containing protein [Escherichia fergusonii]
VRTGVKQRMHYDDAHRLVTVEILNDRDWSRVTFSYDALGRRTEKRAWRQGAEKPERTVFEWSGMRLCGEHNEKSPAAHTLYLYEENSYQPLARVDRYSGGNEPWQRVLYYHTLPNGYPQCMTDSDGGIVWRARVQLWGNIRFEENRDIYSVHPQQNLRFAGQYLDRETGLHYNTFRYFLPESGRFSQPDPIGLKGGLNLYQYAPNPLSWIDPLGLDVIRVYHYTSKDGYNGIMGSGTIKTKDPGARAKGSIQGKPQGVYVTTLSPEELKSSGLRGKMGLTKEKSTHFISFEIDSSKVKRVDRQNGYLRLYIEEEITLRDANNKLRGDVKHGTSGCK